MTGHYGTGMDTNAKTALRVVAGIFGIVLLVGSCQLSQHDETVCVTDGYSVACR